MFEEKENVLGCFERALCFPRARDAPSGYNVEEGEVLGRQKIRNHRSLLVGREHPKNAECGFATRCSPVPSLLKGLRQTQECA
jgi:hypothetical protein